MLIFVDKIQNSFSFWVEDINQEGPKGAYCASETFCIIICMVVILVHI